MAASRCRLVERSRRFRAPWSASRRLTASKVSARCARSAPPIFPPTPPARGRLCASWRRPLSGLTCRIWERSKLPWSVRCWATATRRARSTSPAGTPSVRRPECRSVSFSAAGAATSSRSTRPYRSQLAAEMTSYVAARRAEGFHRFQLKVGDVPQDDVARIRSVADAIGPDEADRRRRQRRLVGCRTQSSPFGPSTISSAFSSSNPVERSRSA